MHSGKSSKSNGRIVQQEISTTRHSKSFAPVAKERHTVCALLWSDVSIWIVYTLTVFCKSWFRVHYIFQSCIVYDIYLIALASFRIFLTIYPVCLYTCLLCFVRILIWYIVYLDGILYIMAVYTLLRMFFFYVDLQSSWHILCSSGGKMVLSTEGIRRAQYIHVIYMFGYPQYFIIVWTFLGPFSALNLPSLDVCNVFLWWPWWRPQGLKENLSYILQVLLEILPL